MRAVFHISSDIRHRIITAKFFPQARQAIACITILFVELGQNRIAAEIEMDKRPVAINGHILQIVRQDVVETSGHAIHQIL